MSWDDHVNAFQARWIIRYLAPTQGKWKEIIDHFLLDDKRGTEVFPEKRMIIFCKSTDYQKNRIISRIPRKFTYLRQCFRQFWKLGLHQDTQDLSNRDGELVWHNWRFNIDIDYNDRLYFKKQINIVLLADIIEKETGNPFTREQWLKLMIKEETNKTSTKNRKEKVEILISALNQIPEHIWEALKQYTSPEINHNDKVYWIHPFKQLESEPTIFVKHTSEYILLMLVWIDDYAIGYSSEAGLRWLLEQKTDLDIRDEGPLKKFIGAASSR